MCSGEKAIPAEHCKAIEEFSEGQVSCREMRPTDWHKYWPELAKVVQVTAKVDAQTGEIQTDTLREGTVRREETRRAGELAIPLEDRRGNDAFAQGV